MTPDLSVYIVVVIIRSIVNAGIIFAISALEDNPHILLATFLIAFVLSVLNGFARTFLIFFNLLINSFNLAVFSILTSFLTVMLVNIVVRGFNYSQLLPAIISSALMWVASGVLEYLASHGDSGNRWQDN